ncbi:unnamed protein product [Ilex paraguariensis]|uniref:Glucosamine/galactosamine-6-phosphate isomerase domain-containing protein n=1 Tax=Ilex paraguariensis TaxID=185542 RepID=A0ABC8T307_9AQUA
MADKKDVRKFDTEESVAVALADHVAGLSEKFIKEKGSITIVLSGGTPINTLGMMLIIQEVLEAPYKRTVDWVNWLVFWVYESVGPVTDPDNYFNQAKKGFLSKVLFET